MNTGKSVIYGWGALLVCAGGSYLYVRREVDERHRIVNRAGIKDTRVLTYLEIEPIAWSGFYLSGLSSDVRSQPGYPAFGEDVNGGDERLKLDEELDAARAKVKETGAAIAALTPSVPSITTPAPELVPDDAPKKRRSYLRP